MCLRCCVPEVQVRQPSTASRRLANVVPSDWYSQCLPGTGGGQPEQPEPTTTASNPAPTGGNGNGGGSGGSGLHGKFNAKGKLYFGTEMDNYHLNNAALTNIVKSDFGQITCENSMKWDATEREYSLLDCWILRD